MLCSEVGVPLASKVVALMGIIELNCWIKERKKRLAASD